jgi:protein-disulfide isomerase
MLRNLTAVTLAAAIAAAGFPAAAEMDSAEKGEIERIVRDYLVANPEVIEQALQALQAKREADAIAAQAKAIEESNALIFDSANQMVLGNPEGTITLVEFFDYNCGYCRRTVPDMTALIDANPDLRVVLKEFPILTPGSVEAARVSIAVAKLAPEKALDFHREVFLRPGEANSAKALAVAKDLGLDVNAVEQMANDKAATGNLQEVQHLATLLGISGTPSFVIGAEVVPGAAGYDALQEKVAAVRACGATVC